MNDEFVLLKRKVEECFVLFCFVLFCLCESCIFGMKGERRESDW